MDYSHKASISLKHQLSLPSADSLKAPAVQSPTSKLMGSKLFLRPQPILLRSWCPTDFSILNNSVQHTKQFSSQGSWVQDSSIHLLVLCKV